MHTKEIKIKVTLDDENIPVDIEWDADDNNNNPIDCKAFMLSIFDKEHMETLKIDLWTKDFQVNEMDQFTFQTLRSLADTYYRATQNSELANQMQQFVTYFGQKTGLIKPEE